MVFDWEDLDEASEEEDLPRTSQRKLLDHCVPDKEMVSILMMTKRQDAKI